jgi:ADP-ribose pyrophosphatase YjhB (NUDIX family)
LTPVDAPSDLPLFRAQWAMNQSDANLSRFPTLGVGAVIWNAKHEVVLIQRGKPPRENQWSIPGGHVEWGEGVHEAVLREVREETGLSRLRSPDSSTSSTS